MFSRLHLSIAICALACWSTSTPVAAQASSASSASVQPNLVISADGAYVLDLRGKLIWPRCVEGMRWNGKTCIGLRMLFTYADAVEIATTRSQSDGLRWRLPRVTELRHLVDKKGTPPGLNPVLFPNSPTDLYWTSTPTIRHSEGNQYDYSNIVQNRTGDGSSTLSPMLGWTIDPQTGDAVGDVAKDIPLAIRFVRPFD